MDLASQFLEWSKKRDAWFTRFIELADLVQSFLLQYVLADREYGQQVAERLLDVLQNCDRITYEEPGTSEAYAILHFLDRYHRFQLISRRLIELNLLPLSTRDIHTLDAGTGPGPALFAISDTYLLLQQFGTEHDMPMLRDLRVHYDYVERSRQFRNWLHSFTEFANYHNPDKPWQVPYHHGTFLDFQSIEFDQKRSYWDYDNGGEQTYASYTQEHRFNLIIFSNFLTEGDQVESLSSELRQSVRYLRNRGILLVVGARSHSNKYTEV